MPRKQTVARSLMLVVALAGWGCNGLTDDDELPADVNDPAATRTPKGALGAYAGTLMQLRDTYGTMGPTQPDGNHTGALPFVKITGLLSDELMTVAAGGNSAWPDVEDTRVRPEREEDPPGTSYGGTYSALQRVRGQAGQAIGLLGDYIPENPALVGHMYAAEGYAEIFLAELFCSGIPLTTLDYNGGYTLRAGSTTAEVFTHAVALFDSALAVSGDSVRVMNLARVGKARALLALGQHAAAATVVGAVPDDYSYTLDYSAVSTVKAQNFTRVDGGWDVTVADFEGAHGLDYVTSIDPRTLVTARGTIPGSGDDVWHPNKYLTSLGQADGSTPIVLANGVEARLIEAEAALQAGDAMTWLSKLNALRTAGFGTVPPDTILDTLGITGCSPAQICGADGVSGGTFQVPAGYALTDSFTISLTQPERTRCRTSSTYPPCAPFFATSTVRVYVRPAFDRWTPGIGGVPDLPPLDDPGTIVPNARVDLLFRERALWLFLTGHRQGDLRRLIRQYGRGQDQVYPTGSYPRGFISYPAYGAHVNAPVPAVERALNPKFTGCINRDA